MMKIEIIRDSVTVSILPLELGRVRLSSLTVLGNVGKGDLSTKDCYPTAYVIRSRIVRVMEGSAIVMVRLTELRKTPCYEPSRFPIL